MRAPGLVGIVVAVGLGCGQRTEIVVGVATDLKVPQQVDLVRMQVVDGQGQLLVAHEWPLIGAGAFVLPGSFGVGVRSSEPFEVRVEGLLRRSGVAADGTLLSDLHVSRRAQLGFVDGRTLFLRLALRGSCYDKLEGACPSGQWCTDGLCRPVAVDPRALPDFSPRDVTTAQCGDGAAVGLGAPSQAACPGTESCVDAVCVASPAIDAQPAVAPEMGPAVLSDAALTDAAVADVLVPAEAGALDAALDLSPRDSAVMLDQSTAVDATLADATLVDLAMPDLSSARVDASAPPIVSPTFGWVSPSPVGGTVLAASYDASNGTVSPLWAVTSSRFAIHLDAGGRLVSEPTGAVGALRAVVAGGGQVWASGDGGAIVHRAVDGTWSSLPTPSAYGVSLLDGLAYDGAGGVLASGQRVTEVGDKRILVRADSTHAFLRDGFYSSGAGGSFRSPTLGTSGGQPCGYLAQGNATLLSYDAPSAQWTALAETGLPTVNTLSFQSVYGCGDGAIAIASALFGGGFFIYHRAGGAWANHAPAGLTSAYKTTSLFAAGADRYAWFDNGKFGAGLYRFDGTTWMLVPTSLPHGASATLVAGGLDGGGNLAVYAFPTGSIYARQTDGSFLSIASSPAHVDGKPWGDGRGLLVAPAPLGQVWYTTASGAPQTPWQQSPTPGVLGNVMQVTAAATGGPRYYAVTDAGQVLSTGDLTVGFTVEYAPAGLSFAGVWAADATTAYAVGHDASSGVIHARLSGGAWAEVYNAPGTLLAAVAGASSTEVYVGGAGVNQSGSRDPTLLRGSGTTWSSSLVPARGTGGPLDALWVAASGELWAGGLAGLVYHVSAGSASSLVNPARGRITAIAGDAPDDVILVSDSGEVVRWDGTSLRLVTNALPLGLDGVFLEPRDVWVGGLDNVLVMQR